MVSNHLGLIAVGGHHHDEPIVEAGVYVPLVVDSHIFRATEVGLVPDEDCLFEELWINMIVEEGSEGRSVDDLGLVVVESFRPSASIVGDPAEQTCE